MTWPHALLNPARIGTAIALACLLAFAAPALAVTSFKPHHHHTGSKRSRTSGPEPGPPTTPDMTPTTPDMTPTTPDTTTPYTPPATTTPPAAVPEAPAPAPVAAPATHKATTKHKPRPKKHHHAKPAAAKPKPKPPPTPKAAAKPLSDPIVSQSPDAMSLALIPLVLLVLAAALAATAIGIKVIRPRRLAAGDPEAYAYEYDTPAQGFEAVSPQAAKDGM